MSFASYVIPCFIAFVLIYALVNKVDVFEEFLVGAKEGLKTAVKIIPALVALMTCVGMFKASGGLDVITYALSPLTNLLSLPSEIVPLALLRPISGSGALALYSDLLVTYGADSNIGRIASVLMGSSETTFYTIAIYFGAYKITKIRHTVFCALLADITCFLISAMIVSIFFPV